jgi:hypothetical protein
MAQERSLRSVPGRRVAVVIVVVAGLLLLVAAVVPATAAPLTADQVQAATETWVRAVATVPRPDARAERLDPYPASGRPAAYVVHLAGGGYCLAGADDRLLPVTLYQPTDAYDGSIPDLKYMLDDYARRLDRLEAAAATGDPSLAPYATALAARRAQWAALVARVPPTQVGAPRYRDIPLTLMLPLTSAWDQGSPYNDQCPVVTPGSDEHVVVGCVATAAAQIMKYWQWPPAPSGVSSTVYNRRFTSSWISTPLPVPVVIPAEYGGRLEWVSTSGGFLRMNGFWDQSMYDDAADIAGGLYPLALATLWTQMLPFPTTLTVVHNQATFDWSLMGDDHTDPPDAGDAEAAELSYHFAVAVRMNFGLMASGAHTEDAPLVYMANFFYDSDVFCGTAFDGVMVDDLAWGRPVQLSGRDDNGGHSWVVYGYDLSSAPIKYWMNIGWGGAPHLYTREEIFPEDQVAVDMIAPAGPVRFVGATLSGDGSPANPYANLTFAAGLAPSGATLIFKAGSDNPFSGSSVTIDRPMTLKGIDVTIRPQ